MFVPAAFQCGLDTVRDSIEDPVMIKFIRKGLFEEIIPSMEGDRKALEEYAKDVLERFDNPFIRHMLISITLNTTAKFPVRDLPSVTGYIGKTGKIPPVLAFSLAALTTFYNGKGIANRQMKGVNKHNGEDYFIQDDEKALHFFEDLYASTDDSAKLAHAVLSHKEFWGEDLTTYSGLEQAVAAGIGSIRKNGMKKAVQLVAEA